MSGMWMAMADWLREWVEEHRKKGHRVHVRCRVDGLGQEWYGACCENCDEFVSEWD